MSNKPSNHNNSITSASDRIELIVLGTAIGFLGLAASIMASTRTNATGEDSVEDNVAITVPTACTMGGSIATGNEHTATLLPGTYSGTSGSGYENGIGKTTLTVFCNDYNGFSIYAVGYTGDSMDNENHTKLVGTSASGNATIPTKVYESTDTTSNWSMKVDKITDAASSYNPSNMTITSSFNFWHTVPDTYTKVAEYHATTGSSATDTTLGAKVETTYAAYISSTQPADTYTGKVKYTMVHPYSEQPLSPQPSTAGYITYYANAQNTAGTMGTQSATDNASVTLYSSNFSRPGYGFAGWSDSYDYATNPNAHFYGPMETITVPTGTTANGLSLYAVWVKSAGSLQDATKVATLCGTGTGSLTQAPIDGTANLTSVSALTDERDNQTYAIAKLADGNCWMIENLRLENTGQHNTDGSLAQGYNSSFIGLATPESADFSNSTTANSLYSTDGSTDATISGSYQGYRFPRYNNFNTQQRATNTTNTNVNTYSYGNYYTWHAAIADTTHNGTNNSSSDTTSICPKGWRLPHGGQTTVNTTAEFYLLGKALMGQEPDQDASSGYGYYGNSVTNSAGDTATKAFRKYPNNFLYSGYFYTSSAFSRGSYGRYWSSTAVNNYYSYSLYLNSSFVNPGAGSNDKYVGRSIRCTVGT